MALREIEVSAPAKVNLFLAVLGKRHDGYHDIVSVMQKIDLVDRLHLELAGQAITLRCPSSNLPADSTNLAWRAARLFFDHTGIDPWVRITLRKAIPVAAGLGGGSSDAAAVLLGLDRLYGSGLAEEALLALAARLGADVPFFVAPQGAALATGTGTQLQAITVPQGYWLVLVNPGLAVATRWVYENLVLTSVDNPYKLIGSFHHLEDASSLLDAVFAAEPTRHSLRNDLEAVTVGRYPIIDTIKAQLMDDGAFAALMSGSGPTVFGLFRHVDSARKSYARLHELYPHVFLASPLS